MARDDDRQHCHQPVAPCGRGLRPSIDGGPAPIRGQRTARPVGGRLSDRRQTEGYPQRRSSMLTAEAKFNPLVDEPRHQQLLETLRRRGRFATRQSSFPRTEPKPARWSGHRYGLHVADVPSSRRTRELYPAARYMQSHGATCKHNQVDGIALTNVTLDVLQPEAARAFGHRKAPGPLAAIGDPGAGVELVDVGECRKRKANCQAFNKIKPRRNETWPWPIRRSSTRWWLRSLTNWAVRKARELQAELQDLKQYDKP